LLIVVFEAFVGCIFVQAIKLKKIKAMNTQKLTITGINLDTNKNVSFTIKASNHYMLAKKYLEVVNPLHIEDWNLENNEWNCGNKGMNAGAYLCETMEQLSGLKLN